jgi:hypothetical protein
MVLSYQLADLIELAALAPALVPGFGFGFVGLVVSYYRLADFSELADQLQAQMHMDLAL